MPSAVSVESPRHEDVGEEIIPPTLPQSHGDASAWSQHVLAIVNTLSGERKAIKHLLKMLYSDLGKDRVYTLDKETFQNTAKLERRIQQATYCHVLNEPVRHTDERTGVHPYLQASEGEQPRGTVIVAGGDGTVSFVYQVLGKMALKMAQGGVSSAGPSPNSSTSASASSPPASASHWVLPALAVIPLGTGNDYSNCMGFGAGFKADEGCCGSDHAPLKELATAPCFPFDRWRVTFIPLRYAQRTKTASGVAFATRHGARMSDAIHAVDWDAAAKPVEQRDTAPDVVLSDSSSFAPPAIPTSYHLINYLGIGFDAYVCTNFDKSRRAHPGFCSTRTANKMVYGVHSLRGAVNCTALKDFVPMICVPSPATGTTATSPASAPGLAAAAAGDGAFGSHSMRRSQRHPRRAPYVPLALPGSSKALVASNVDRYAAGTTPWGSADARINTNKIKFRIVDIQGDKLVRVKQRLPIVTPSPLSPPPPSATHRRQPAGTADSDEEEEEDEEDDGESVEVDELPALPALKKVGVNDGLLELQSMGGVLHFGSLQMGLSKSDKLTQATGVYAFVMCTPQDLLQPEGEFSPYSQKAFKSAREEVRKKAVGSLYVQVDGEPVPPIREPMVVRVSKEAGEVWGRCSRRTSVG